MYTWLGAMKGTHGRDFVRAQFMHQAAFTKVAQRLGLQRHNSGLRGLVLGMLEARAQ